MTDVAKDFSIRTLARAALPQNGDHITDRRFDPAIDYPWKESLQESELKALWQAKLNERQARGRKTPNQ